MEVGHWAMHDSRLQGDGRVGPTAQLWELYGGDSRSQEPWVAICDRGHPDAAQPLKKIGAL